MIHKQINDIHKLNVTNKVSTHHTATPTLTTSLSKEHVYGNAAPDNLWYSERNLSERRIRYGWVGSGWVGSGMCALERFALETKQYRYGVV